MKEPSDADQDPLAALSAGRPEPFEAFVASEAHQLMAFFQRLGAARVEAEDLVQELFLKLFQQAKNYERQGRFKSYVLRVARNAWIDRIRRRGVRGTGFRATGSGGEESDEGATVAVEWALSREPDPGADAERREQWTALQRAWSVLPEHHRLVFELGVLQERSYDEISEVLNVPVGTVKSRMFYALRKLREQSGALALDTPRGAERRE